MTAKITEQLDRLTALRTISLINADVIEDLLLRAVQEAGLTERHDGLLTEKAAVALEIKALEGEIKSAVTDHGKSVKTADLHAVYSMRSSWDSKGLKGYAVAHPELNAFLKEKPSVSIRTVKPKEPPTDETPTPKTETPSVPGIQEGKGPTLGNLVVDFAKGFVRAQQARS